MPRNDPESIEHVVQHARWTEAFHRSRLSPVVFNVPIEHTEAVDRAVDQLGLPSLRSYGMYEGDEWSTPLLEGFLLGHWSFMFPAGHWLPSGTRVVGFHAFRLLCELVSLVPPSRPLRGEGEVPTAAELLHELERQRNLGEDTLLAQAKRGLYVEDRWGLLLLVRDLYGAEYLPADPDLDLNLQQATNERQQTLRHHEDHRNIHFRASPSEEWQPLPVGSTDSEHRTG